jgi:DNA polymerase I-like protein with 3'-5' exonuclease and polymerase domains
MPIVQTADLRPDLPLAADVQHQVYCGLDNCLTVEIRHAEEPLLAGRPNAARIYSFERALQAPYLDLMLRGFAVDQQARREASTGLEKRILRLQQILNQLSFALWSKSLNARSSKQLQDFFYGTMKLPELWQSQKGVRKLSMNREALEKLYDRYLYARPFIACILTIRDLSKQQEVFDTEIDSDGRFRTSYNIAGTETGRPSSSSNAFGTGGNAQNIAPSLRYVFVSDPGYKIAVIDAEQVEARDVGFFCGCLFDDWTFLDACESGDLHTTNATRIWPELGWTDNKLHNRKLADTIFYRDFSYRDMAKRGSHLSNYMGTAWTASRALKVPLKMMEDFQSRYCRGPSAAYPCIPRWWQWTAEQLQTTHLLTTPFGRERHFFGRPDDDTTLREAIADLPQSTTADRTNLCLWRVWKHMPQVQLLAQTYDSITFQYRETDDEDAILEQALELLRLPLTAPNNRIYNVPWEAKIGWNWGNYNDDPAKGRLNPGGLTKWNHQKKDLRKRPSYQLLPSHN